MTMPADTLGLLVGRNRSTWRAFLLYLRLFRRSFINSAKEYFSIRTRAFMDFAGIAMEIGVWGILAVSVVGSNLDSTIARYGARTYAEFVLSGLMLARLLDLASPIHRFFFRRTYLTYHNKPLNLLLVNLIRHFDLGYTKRVVTLAGYILVAWLLFGVSLRWTSLALWIVIFFGAIFRLGVNLFSAGWYVVTKGGSDPLNWFYSSTRRLFTGEIFPIDVLPGWLLLVSKVHPMTYVNTLARKAGLGEAAFPELASEMGTLIPLSIFFLILGYGMLRLCVKRAKAEGTMKWSP